VHLNQAQKVLNSLDLILNGCVCASVISMLVNNYQTVVHISFISAG